MLVDEADPAAADARFQRYLDRLETSLHRQLAPLMTAAIRMQVTTNAVKAEDYLIKKGGPILLAHYRRIYREQYRHLDKELKGAVAWETKADSVLDFMREQAAYLNREAAAKIRNISASQRKAIHNLVLNGVVEGRSNQAIAKEIRAAAASIGKRRSATIARTETHNSALAAIEETLDYKQIEVKQKQWWSAQDDRVRPTHREVHGQIIPFDEAFEVGDYQMMRPGDDSLGAGPEEVINCRCALIMLTSRPEPGAGVQSNAAELYEPPTLTEEELIEELGGDATEQVAEITRKVDALPQTHLPVEKGGYRMPDGSYTAERRKLHQKIIDTFLSKEKVTAATPISGAPTLTVLGGRGGSGKSWITDGGPVDKTKAILLDADAVKEMLKPEYKAWNAGQVHEESSDVLDMIHAKAVRLGVNVIHDATLKTLKSAEERIAQYEKNGYQLEGYYMYLRPDEAARRALGRFSKGGTWKGRFVQPRVILGNTQNEKNFDALSKKFVRWKIYDNSGATRKLVAEGGKP